jgi:hypothetical protein
MKQTASAKSAFLAALLAHVSQEAKPKWQKIETAPKETTK